MKSRFLTLFGVVILLIGFSVSTEAQLCTTKEAGIMDKQSSKFDTTKGRGLADNFFLWKIGKTINVRFMNGTSEQHQKVLNLAKTWEKYANVHFALVSGEPSNVRVEFSDKRENYSLLGTNSNMVPSMESTMHLENGLFQDTVRLKRTVVHEFGHVLGFMHEHSSPISGIQWNKDTMYKEYASFGWDKDMVDAQVFKTYDKRYTNGTSYDKKSIMHYPIPSYQTVNGYGVGWNTEVSEGDKQLAALLYPFSGERANEVPRVNILDYTTSTVKQDPVAGGLNIYPSFTVTTEGVSGDVYFAVLLYDKDGYPIKATSEKYNVSGCVGSYKAFRMAPDKRLSANKVEPEDFPLFIPFDNIPAALKNSEIQVVFRTFVSDGVDMKSIYYSEPVAYKLNIR